MGNITIFIKENGPAFVVTDVAGGVLSPEQNALCIKAFGTEPRRIDLTHEELHKILAELDE